MTASARADREGGQVPIVTNARSADPALALSAHTAAVSKSTKQCPVCGAEFARNQMGRPKRFCTDDCRREFAALREELPLLVDELADARIKAESWSNTYYWTGRVGALELAIEQARMRLGDDR